MLVLSRDPGEAIYTGEEIDIVILSVKGIHVRIGIAAPRDVPVLRSEIYQPPDIDTECQ